MRRSPYEQWMRALRRKEQRDVAALPALTQVLAGDTWTYRDASEKSVAAEDLLTLRPLASIRGRSPFTDDTSDIDGAIRLLQRHNRELRTCFGMGWVDATQGVLGEATRRGASVTLVARKLCRALSARE
jgi:hypothetical protein